VAKRTSQFGFLLDGISFLQLLAKLVRFVFFVRRFVGLYQAFQCATGWTWLTHLKSNRLVNRDRQGKRPLCRTEIAATGTEVWLPGYGLVKVFKIVAPDGDIAYWATGDLGMTDLTRQQYAEYSWAIENYHRGIKQCTEVERCQVRSARAQRNHIGLALRAFLRLEVHCFAQGISWLEAKTAIVRDAVRSYLAHPRICLPETTTA
jgi:hypothetical protein